MKKRIDGITLIALIITIIILLILASVSIATLVGENGIITRAREAKENTEIASIKEQIQMDIFGKQVENQGKITDENLKEILEKYGTLSGEEKIIEKTLTTKEGKYEIKVAEIYNGTMVKDEPKNPTVANAPNIYKIAQKTYVTWSLNEDGTEYVINDTQTTEPNNWYDYENGKWANIKTTANGLEAYWVWIPRYEYIVPTSTTATQIEVQFIPKNKTTPDEGYTIHPAFTNEGNGGLGELDGIWVAKFEASSNTTTPDTNYGGGDDSNLKVQIRPGVQSWRNITSNNIFTVCRKMTNSDNVLAGSTVDSHMMKNTEWGAVAILSQSKYGVYNPESLNGEKGNKEYQIWNNSSSSYITGSVGTSKDADNTITTTFAYDSANGPKASTTGTIYGVYDMAGGSLEYVAGCLNGQENAKFGVAVGESKYVDLYTNTSNSGSNYDGSKIGDAIKEVKGWNSDHGYFVNSYNPVFKRGRLFRQWYECRYLCLRSRLRSYWRVLQFPCGVSPISRFDT